ncbi:hypothetical protein PSCLAVI8L_20032 [Pseudoclavibacter sp. 8L]|nr:hypothetical protein PSCLAVI8L_20032 [Pseudoclavibacter sp. 8L]
MTSRRVAIVSRAASKRWRIAPAGALDVAHTDTKGSESYFSRGAILPPEADPTHVD